MNIQNINTGVDPARIQQNRPAFFVNWIENGQQKYEFFSMRFSCEARKNKLVKMRDANLKVLNLLVKQYSEGQITKEQYDKACKDINY